jgi:hypothetical protein
MPVVLLFILANGGPRLSVLTVSSIETPSHAAGLLLALLYVEFIFIFLQQYTE